MIRKSTAIFFILLANIILLAHVVVPHHHHHQIKVCVNASHCQSDGYAHSHATHKSDHEHDGEHGSEFCVLKQAVFIPSNQAYKCLGCTDKQFPSNDFQAVLFNNGLISFVPKIVSNAQIPFITSSYLHFSQSSLGLRAPPIV